jgi:hypothetical protein
MKMSFDSTHLNVVVTIVMQVKHTINLAVSTDSNVVDALDAFGDILSCIFLHLNVVKFPGKERARGNH